MKLHSEWSKKEVLQLTGLSRGKLEYLDKVGLLQPIRYGSCDMPIIVYTWEQLVALKAYAEMRKDCSLQALRQALDFLQLEDPITHIAKKQLVACGNKVYWIYDSPQELAVIVSGNMRGQRVFIIKGNELLERLWDEGENNVLDFAARAKEKPCSRRVA